MAEARDLPWRRTLDPYAIWVSEIMLQQTQVRTVIPYWTRWMEELPDVASLAAVEESRLLKLWEGLGYYRRARMLQRAAKMLMENSAGTLPQSAEALMALPGIGRYTAGAIASIAFNQPSPILDGNVIRVLTRLFAIDGNPKDTGVNTMLWQLAKRLVRSAVPLPCPDDAATSRGLLFSGTCSMLNQSLMELGALICQPASPQCGKCPLRVGCLARKHGLTSALPALGKRPPTTLRTFAAFVIGWNDRFLVRRRQAGEVNGGLWEFPTLALDEAEGGLTARAMERFGITVPPDGPFLTIRHSITRYRMELRVFRASDRSARRKLNPHEQWMSPQELASAAFSSAHRRIADQLARGGRHVETDQSK